MPVSQSPGPPSLAKGTIPTAESEIRGEDQQETGSTVEVNSKGQTQRGSFLGPLQA